MRHTATALTAWLAASCATPPPPPPAKSSALSQATAKAQATLPTFRARLSSSTSTDEVFGVLLDAPGGGCVGDDVVSRARWLETVQLRGDVVSGIVDSGSVGGGAVVSGHVDDVCDWVIAVGDVIDGGFTLRVQRAGLSPEEQAAFDRSVGGHFGPEGVE